MKSLSQKQIQILKLIKSGKNTKEIAESLGLSEGRIKHASSEIAKNLKVELKEGLLAFGRVFDDSHPLLSKISPAERLVLEQLCKGISNNRISQNLFIAEKTVKFHITNINKKIGTSSRYQLISTFTKSENGDLDSLLNSISESANIISVKNTRDLKCEKSDPDTIRLNSNPLKLVEGEISDTASALPVGSMNILWSQMKKNAA